MNNIKLIFLYLTAFSIFFLACKKEKNDTIENKTEPFQESNLLKTWVLNAKSDNANMIWQPLTNICYDDDLHSFEANKLYKVETGPIVGECSSCISCYFNDGSYTFSAKDSLLVLLKGNSQIDSLKIYSLKENELIVDNWNTTYRYFRLFKPKN